MKDAIRFDVENGYYLFKLEKVLHTRNISINKLMRDTNTDFKVLKRIIKGDLVRFDIFVIARICDYLDCKITDIIEYFPNQKADKEAG
jgi:putative transcriptional regulator